MLDTSITPPPGDSDTATATATATDIAKTATSTDKNNAADADETISSQLSSLCSSLCGPNDPIAASPPKTPASKNNDIADDDSERRSNSVNFSGVVDSSFSIHNDSENEDENSSDASIQEFGGDPRIPPMQEPTSGSSTMGIDGAPSTPATSAPSPPSPGNSKSRPGVSKLGREVNRPEVKEKPLIDEIREVLAQSYLIFLLADLRFLSGTGRIATKYENVAMDSDVYKRDSAKQVACLLDNVKDDQNKQISHFRGLSPAVIMAIVILEIRDNAVKMAEKKAKSRKMKGKKKMRYATSEDIDDDHQFVGYEGNEEKKKVMEESLDSLMRCYSRMVSEDFVTDIPNVQRRRATYQTDLHPSDGNGSNRRLFTRKGATTEEGEPSKPPLPPPLPFNASRATSAPVKSLQTTRLGSVQEGKVGAVGLETEPKPKDDADTSESFVPKPSSFSFRGDRGGEDGSKKSRMQLFSPSKWNKGTSTGEGQQIPHHSLRDQLKMTAENSRMIADRIKTDFNQKVDKLTTNYDAKTQMEFEELTDVFFKQGETNEEVKATLGATYSRKEMIELMRNAVEARSDDRLQFLPKMFKKGSTSRLMAESHARIVWVNDWYPQKDLTYAISVDTLKRRVMVVFRGAITKKDWSSTVHFWFHKIRNPIKDDFEGKHQTLRVFIGIYTYLFRKRKDTGTTKYDEIANMAHKYGLERIGPDYKLFVTGHSLGGALTHFFAFHASTEERFTKNGPVKAIGFASPYIGGHEFADSYRHQERMKKVQLVICRNSNDVIPRLPGNFVLSKRGPLWRHVGIGVTLPPLPKCGFKCGAKWRPMVHYWGKEKSFLDSTIHGYRRNILWHFSYLRPWTLSRAHTLFELQDRFMYGESNSEEGGGFALLQYTLDELYEKLEENDFASFKKTKWWDKHRRNSRAKQTNTSEISDK